MEHSSRSPGDVVSDDGQLRITRLGDEPWLVVAGEIDEYSYKSLIRTLASVARDPSEIHIDLADVEYCDVAGLRAFVVLAAAPCRDHAGIARGAAPCAAALGQRPAHPGLGHDIRPDPRRGAGKSTDPLGPQGRDVWSRSSRQFGWVGLAGRRRDGQGARVWFTQSLSATAARPSSCSPAAGGALPGTPYAARLAGGFCLRAPARAPALNTGPAPLLLRLHRGRPRALPGLLRLGRAGPGAARLPGARPHPVPEQNLSLAVSGRLFP